MITGISDKLEFILSGTETSQEEFNQIIDLMEEYKALNLDCVIVPVCPLCNSKNSAEVDNRYCLDCSGSFTAK
jgi:hypothetical protein